MVCRAARVVHPRHPLPIGRDTSAALLLTLGAGTRMSAPSFSLFQRAAPYTLIPDKSMLDTNLYKAIYLYNSRLPYPATPGVTGELAHTTGYKTAALADARSIAEQNLAILWGMDSMGEVDYAGNRLQYQSAEQILQGLDALPHTPTVVFITLFDLTRAEHSASLCLPNIAEKRRHAALLVLNQLLNGLMKRQEELLILCSPGPEESAPRGDRIAPLMIAGLAIHSDAFFSDSTRREGLAVNTDILPTLAQTLGVSSPNQAVGRALRMVHSGKVGAANMRLAYEQLLDEARLQDIFGGLPTIQLLVLIAGILSIKQGRKNAAVALGAVLASMPLALLLLPVLSPESVVWGGIFLSAALLFVAAAALILSKRSVPPEKCYNLLWISLLTVCIADLVTGTRLLSSAWMSYSVMEGARYFGIGNEYMGALIGAALCLLPNFANRKYGFLAFMTLSIILTVTMGWPEWGAKAGAIPSAGIAFSAALIVWKTGRRPTWKEITGITALLFLTLLGMAGLDKLHGRGGESHLGRALSGHAGGSWAEIARRKLAMEGYLILHSPWSLTLLGAGIAFLYLVKTHPAEPSDHAFRAGALAGVLSCLLFNDAGVAAAAILLTAGTAREFASYYNANRPPGSLSAGSGSI